MLTQQQFIKMAMVGRRTRSDADGRAPQAFLRQTLYRTAARSVMDTEMPAGIQADETCKPTPRIRTRVDTIDKRQVARFGQWEVDNG